MEIIYLEDGLLDRAKKFDSVLHSESELYIKDNQLFKILLEGHRDEIKKRSIIKLSEFDNKECCIPNSLIYKTRVDNLFTGLAIDFLEYYSELQKEFYTLPYKDRLIIAKKVALLFESFENKQFVYTDIHLRNILLSGSDIKLIDMDGGCFSSIIGETRYKELLNHSYKRLSLYMLILLSGIQNCQPRDIINNIVLLKKHSNKNQTKVINSATTLEQDKGYHVSDYLDSFTEEYIEDTKKRLISR